MFIDIDCSQEKKHKQHTYGDFFISRRYQDFGRLIAVLSDGLGSGVKANILATMTATMLLKFVKADSDIGKSCEIIMNALPVCKVLKISYSTFSVFDCSDDGEVTIVEEGNPQFVWIREGYVLQPDSTVITSKAFPNRHMRIYKISLEKFDRLLFCSDGVTQAGLGNPQFKLGLRRSGLIDLVLKEIAHDPLISSRELAQQVVRYTLQIEVEQQAHDDISAVSVYCRDPREALVFTGPPYYADKDGFYANIFKNFNNL